MKLLRILLLGGLASVAACVPRTPAPPPPPQPQPQQQRPVRPAPPAPPPPRADWRDVPVTPGVWVYRNREGSSQALYGPANSEADFIVQCDRARSRIVLLVEGARSGGTMTVRTSFAARNLPVTMQTGPVTYAAAELAPSDPFLDGIAFSRGRFTVEAAGLPMLVIPAWPEPARVVEDCRG